MTACKSLRLLESTTLARTLL